MYNKKLIPLIFEQALALGLTYDHELIVATKFDTYRITENHEDGTLICTPTQINFRFLQGKPVWRTTYEIHENGYEKAGYSYSIDKKIVFLITTSQTCTTTEKTYTTHIKYVGVHVSDKPKTPYAEWLQSLKVNDTVIANDYTGDHVGAIKEIDTEYSTACVIFKDIPTPFNFCLITGTEDTEPLTLHPATETVFYEIADNETRTKFKTLLEDVLASNFEGMNVDSMTKLYTQIQVARGIYE